MANVIRIKRKIGSNSAPSALKSAELAWNDAGDILYIGKGDNNGDATSVVEVGGSGSFAKLNSPTFTGTPSAPTPAENDNSTKIATTAYVQTEIAGLNTGTVTSVALSLPTDIFDVSGSPVTTNGTLTATLDSQDANKVWAGPTNGAAAAPTFRALVASDIPSLSSTYQPLDATLSSLSSLGTAADKLAYTTAADTWAETGISNFGRSLIDDASSSDARSTLGLGSMALETASNYLTTSDATNTYFPKSGGTISGSVTITQNLVVQGTTTTISSTTISVGDKNVVLGDVETPTDTTADGGGLTLKGATDKTLNWVDATDAWTSSEHFNLLSGKAYYINGASVLSGNTLGSGVTSSSLTTVGTIGTGVWQGTAVGMTYGGTGANLSGDAAGTIYKKHADGYLTAATAGTDFLNNASTIDGGTY